MKNNKVLITGVTGQDGSFLAKMLLEQGKEIFGTFRKTSGGNFWRLNELDILDNINFIEYQVGQNEELVEAIKHNKFSQIYHLCGDSMTVSSLTHPYQTMNTNIQGLLELLESVRKDSKESLVFVAGSSEIFEKPSSDVVNNYLVTEDHKKQPINPYGVSSMSNMLLVDVYRKQYNIGIAFGIMFNHESFLRGDSFITRKITKGLARIKHLNGDTLEVGNFDSCRDWGAASDFIVAMNLMLESSLNDNYILATGIPHKVRDILEISAEVLGYKVAFESKGLNETMLDLKSGKILARVSEKYLRKFDNSTILGDASKLSAISGWRAKTTFDKLISDMAEFDEKIALNLCRERYKYV